MSPLWEYQEGEWVEGGEEREGAAFVVYCSEPSPETGHEGWCWWACGKMGEAASLDAAKAAAEAVVLARVPVSKEGGA